MALDEFVNTTRASTWPADADPGMTAKLPFRFSTVHVGTLVEGIVDPLLGGEVVGDALDEEEDGVVVGEDVGRVVLRAFGGELPPQPASASPTVDSETTIATRCKAMHRSYWLLSPAGFAQPQHRKVEGPDLEAEPGFGFPRQAGEHATVRLVGRSATLAHEMPVRLSGELVGSWPVAQVRVHHQADPLELIKVAVHGGDMHVRNPPLDLFGELFRCSVGAAHQSSQDSPSACCHPVTERTEAGDEHLYGVAVPLRPARCHDQDAIASWSQIGRF